MYLSVKTSLYGLEESLKAIDRPEKVSLQHYAINAVLNSLLQHKRPCKLLFFLFIIWLYMHTSEFHSGSSRRWPLSLSKAVRIQAVLVPCASYLLLLLEISYNKTGRGKLYELWHWAKIIMAEVDDANALRVIKRSISCSLMLHLFDQKLNWARFCFSMFLNVITFLWRKAEFSASLLQPSVSPDPSEIILICWFGV